MLSRKRWFWVGVILGSVGLATLAAFYVKEQKRQIREKLQTEPLSLVERLRLWGLL